MGPGDKTGGAADMVDLLVKGLITAKDLISSVTDGMYDVYSFYEKFNDSVLNVNKNFGGTLKSINKANSYSKLFYTTMYEANSKMIELGMNAETFATAINDISLQTGTMVGVSKEAAENYALLSAKIGETNMSTMAKDMMSIGYSIKSSANFMADVVDSSQKMGLNSEAVTSQMVSNFKVMSRMNFKGGAKGIADMAKQAVLLGVDMGDVKRIADGLRKPEQAIEFSQKMQMLGGAFGSVFGDAFSVMKKARNDLPALQKDIAKVASSMYKVNDSGEFVMDGANIDILTQAAENFGLQLNDLQNMGERMAKTEYLKKSFSLEGMKDEDLNVLTGFIDFSKSKGGKVKIEGLDKLEDTMGLIPDSEGLVDIASIGAEKMGKLIENLKGLDTEDKNKPSIDAMKEQVKAMVNLTDQVTRLSDQFKSSLPDLAKSVNNLKIGGPGKEKTVSGVITERMDQVKEGLSSTEVLNKTTKVAEDFTRKLLTKVDDASEVLVTGVFNLANSIDDGTLSFKKFFDILVDFQNALTKKEQGGIVKKYNNGGILNGPSHKDGGIPAYIKGSNNMLELEGGEAIINKKSTEMFKPYLSEINKKGGGIEFEKGGISKTNLDSLGSKMYSNVNIGSSTPINVNVNVNGSLKLDNIEYQLTNEQKEDIMKTIGPKIMKDVNQQIGQGSYNTSGKPRKPENKFGF